MTLEPIELPFQSLPGLSERQVSEHYEVLYKGYVNKVNEIREKIKTASIESVNTTYAELRELKLEESFALNAVKLHEKYFSGLGGDGTVTEKVKTWIEKDFSSFEKWQTEFRALGMGARGWVVLYYDWQEMRLSNSLADWHSHGAIWNTTPVLVLDVYEHAYFLDYGTKRKDYLDSFFANINWEAVENDLNQIERLGNL